MDVLEDHEDGHVQRNVAFAQKLQATINGVRVTDRGRTPQAAKNDAKKKLNDVIKKELERQNKERQDEQKEYDKNTCHGKCQYDGPNSNK